MFSNLLMKDGETLSSLLSKNTYSKLKKYFMNYSIYINRYEKFKPGIIVVTLPVVKLQSLGANAPGIDFYYQTKAKMMENKLDFLIP